MRRWPSDIPPGAQERMLREYREQGPVTYLRVVECVVGDRVVGQRGYNRNGDLQMETPLKDGQRHGRVYTWMENGALESVEPYLNGRLHGTARQYGRDGRLIGTYRCVHGTGFDIWRCEQEDGSVHVSEIHTLENGLPHGYEWWLRTDQHSVWHELHWQQGQLHGIERMWNEQGKLRRGYPCYWIRGQAVKRDAYLEAVRLDATLPAFQEEDNRPQRLFPPALERLLAR